MVNLSSERVTFQCTQTDVKFKSEADLSLRSASVPTTYPLHSIRKPCKESSRIILTETLQRTHKNKNCTNGGPDIMIIDNDISNNNHTPSFLHWKRKRKKLAPILPI